MTFYGFAGTWMRDEGLDDTNVGRMLSLYRGKTYYFEGVGAGNVTPITKYIGGAFGFGGKRRIKTAVAIAAHRRDMQVHVVGFSRGAAMAVDFCHRLHHRGMSVSSLTLFDTVASFGLPGRINLGYNLDIPPNVDAQIKHYMSMDEPSRFFPLTRWNRRYRDPRVDEFWLPGCHGDIGRGPRAFAEAYARIPIHHGRLRRPSANAVKMSPNCPKNDRPQHSRKVQPHDTVL